MQDQDQAQTNPSPQGTASDTFVPQRLLTQEEQEKRQREIFTGMSIEEKLEALFEGQMQTYQQVGRIQTELYKREERLRVRLRALDQHQHGANGQVLIPAREHQALNSIYDY